MPSHGETSVVYPSDHCDTRLEKGGRRIGSDINFAEAFPSFAGRTHLVGGAEPRFLPPKLRRGGADARLSLPVLFL